MQEQFCIKNCCIVRYCPLVLAWATTIHKFQGFEAGFDVDDHINYIIADINNIAWEQKKPGTAYTVASRAKTIGTVSKETPYPKDSNLFFDGQISSDRFMYGHYCQDGSRTQAAVKQEAWVNYLMQKSLETKRELNEEKIQSCRTYVSSMLNQIQIHDTNDLQERIVDMIRNPSEIWKKNREKYIL